MSAMCFLIRRAVQVEARSKLSVQTDFQLRILNKTASEKSFLIDVESFLHTI